MVYKASRNNTVEDGTEKYRTSLVFFFVGSSPLNLLLLQVRLLSTSIQGPVATTSDQCINLTSRRSAMATGHDSLVSELAIPPRKFHKKIATKFPHSIQICSTDL
jgi:hypothetical protein